MQFEWKVLTDVRAENGIVQSALYGCFCRDGQFMKESLNTMTFTHDPANSVSYDQVTSELILEWILDNLGSAEVTRVQNYVSDLITAEQTLHAEQLAARQAAESVPAEDQTTQE